MAFHLGSLGFLTPFLFDNFQDQVTNVLEGKRTRQCNIHFYIPFILDVYLFSGNAALTLRSRLKCTLRRRPSSEDAAGLLDHSSGIPTNGTAVNGTTQNKTEKDRTKNRQPMNFLILNEVVGKLKNVIIKCHDIANLYQFYFHSRSWTKSLSFQC